MPTRVLLLRVAIGPELLHGEGPRVGATAAGTWTIQNHQGQVLATLHAPGIPLTEVQLRYTALAVELVRITEP